MKLDYSDCSFKNNGKLKLLIIVGTRPEIIRLSSVINKCRKYFDCMLAHTGQNYDYNLNGIFFKDLRLDDPEVYMDAVGDDLGATVGNIINCSYKLMCAVKPDALLILGDTNSCLSAISAKRLHIPVFHMEAGNRCKDECLPEETNRRIVDIIADVNLAYSEHARRYLADCGCAPERTYVTGSPMAEVLSENLDSIRSSDILEKLGAELSGRVKTLSFTRLLDEVGISCNQAHAPFPTSYGDSRDADVFDSIVRSMEIASIMGAQIIVVHPMQHLNYQEHQRELFQMNVDFYTRLLPYAEKFGIKVATENMWQDNNASRIPSDSVCSRAWEFCDLIDAVNSPWLVSSSYFSRRRHIYYRT